MTHLPLTHVTPWEKFLKITESGYLKPQPCRLFKENLLYLNYGRLAHKPSDKHYNWFENAPVIFFLPPVAINRCERFYPFDTGAVISGKFRNSELSATDVKAGYCSLISPYSNPSLAVDALYGSASEYIRLKKPAPSRMNNHAQEVLMEMYEASLHNHNELDYRLTSIECHFRKAISVNEAMVIALPEYMRREIPKSILKSGTKLFFYNDSSINGYLPKDLIDFSTDLFSSFTYQQRHGFTD